MTESDIADVVRHLTLISAGGTCVQRAFVGNEVCYRDWGSRPNWFMAACCIVLAKIRRVIR
jgi:hypothetical protein